ncbi:DUF3102 domain-containing protein [Staphylococcus saprophyticus]|nr:DUF3102 domain-containing protein [Staphylococcus saprophyticus]MDW4078299.1 DUF3102 domain-containing protein [Staphylococcus saprophyticus]MDW4380493.1 DUF3102 domain-containing protein [Staphylococcus saprophyticus]MDW4382495.1 DUF3102 domain-containing protein [Staphylococcus saprophyticus]
MNELQLSNDLTTIETEIKSYQNIAGQSIFEIGRRLKHVKENDLVHGEFGKWLEKVNMDKSQASKFMKISEEFAEIAPAKKLGLSILYEIANLPKTERNKEHVTSSGESKTPDEMTRKELRELKKELKQRDEEKSQLESQLKQAQRSESIARKQLEDEQDKEPEVVERYMEPEDYEVSKNENSELKRKNSSLEQQIEYYKRKLELKQEDKVVENNSKENEITDARIQINQDNDSIEPEVRKAIRHESSADALITALEEIITIHDQEIEDYELFDKYVSTLNYKALIEAKKKIEHFIKIGGYK